MHLAKKLLGGMAISCVLSACSNSVKIRLANEGPATLKNVVIRCESKSYTFDSIAACSKTPYCNFAKAYRYTYLFFVCHGDTFEQRPTDYVGERKLWPGWHTYHITPTYTAEGNPYIDATMD
ncbi:hypothetical protein GC194_14045 [bacterium]|nr:hypothetical protein [bacterium]